MSDHTLISHSAPTLAGLKVANLFSCECSRSEEADRIVRQWNVIVNPKGVRIRILRYHEGRALIYVYRPAKLEAALQAPAARRILKRFGYDGDNIDAYIKRLAGRIRRSGEFPHEIGLFLGYPPKDVKGFIDNHGSGSIYTGYWKVYTDIDAAKEAFRKYAKCTAVYSKRIREGTSLERLTVRNVGM